MLRIIFGLILAFLVVFAPINQAQAVDCKVVYGGGSIDCAQNSPTPTSTPLKQIMQPNQTKGGLTVYKQTPPPATPATGPEALSLIGLIPMAVGGLYLRKKSK
ncbi:MAG TPA: hypothetical protein VF810_00190 [Patescibacteria group bacterium]